jgi:hypothetical protein
MTNGAFSLEKYRSRAQRYDGELAGLQDDFHAFEVAILQSVERPTNLLLN